jgi:hypothetical protein
MKQQMMWKLAIKIKPNYGKFGKYKKKYYLCTFFIDRIQIKINHHSQKKGEKRYDNRTDSESVKSI